MMKPMSKPLFASIFIFCKNCSTIVQEFRANDLSASVENLMYIYEEDVRDINT